MYTYSVESVVDEMFDILTHSDLSHKLVLVSVHSSQLTDMSKDVLKTISKLFNNKNKFQSLTFMKSPDINF